MFAIQKDVTSKNSNISDFSRNNLPEKSSTGKATNCFKTLSMGLQTANSAGKSFKG